MESVSPMPRKQVQLARLSPLLLQSSRILTSRRITHRDEFLLELPASNSCSVCYICQSGFLSPLPYLKLKILERNTLGPRDVGGLAEYVLRRTKTHTFWYDFHSILYVINMLRIQLTIC